MSYRATPPPPPPPPATVVEYRPRSRGSAIGILILLSIVALVMAVLGVRGARGVSFSCTRSSANGGTCAVVTEYVFGLHTTRRFLLSSVRGTHVDAQRLKNGVSYHFVIETTDGDVEASTGGGEASTQELQFEFERFLHDGKQPSIARVPSPPQPAFALTFFFLSLLPIAIATMMFQSTRLTFDWSDRQLHVTRYRWPIWPVSTRVSISAVAGAGTRWQVAGRRRFLLLDLDLKDGTRIPLSGMSATSLERADSAVSEINEVLAQQPRSS